MHNFFSFPLNHFNSNIFPFLYHLSLKPNNFNFLILCSVHLFFFFPHIQTQFKIMVSCEVKITLV